MIMKSCALLEAYISHAPNPSSTVSPHLYGISSVGAYNRTRCMDVYSRRWYALVRSHVCVGRCTWHH